MRRPAALLLLVPLLLAGPALAQLVDPRTAAGAAGQITDRTAPDIDTPAEIDPSRDPALHPPASAPIPTLPQAAKSAGRDDVQAPPAVDSESTTSAPVFRPQPERPAPPKGTKDGLRR